MNFHVKSGGFLVLCFFLWIISAFLSAALTETFQWSCLFSCSFSLIPKWHRHHVWTQKNSTLTYSCKTHFAFSPCKIHLKSIFQHISGESYLWEKKIKVSCLHNRSVKQQQSMTPRYRYGANSKFLLTYFFADKSIYAGERLIQNTLRRWLKAIFRLSAYIHF